MIINSNSNTNSNPPKFRNSDSNRSKFENSDFNTNSNPPKFRSLQFLLNSTQNFQSTEHKKFYWKSFWKIVKFHQKNSTAFDKKWKFFFQISNFEFEKKFRKTFKASEFYNYLPHRRTKLFYLSQLQLDIDSPNIIPDRRSLGDL